MGWEGVNGTAGRVARNGDRKGFTTLRQPTSLLHGVKNGGSLYFFALSARQALAIARPRFSGFNLANWGFFMAVA